MNQEQRQAYEWAKNQNYQSVAARYAKILAGLVDEIAPPNEPLNEEQLKKMVGEPIWIEAARRKEWMLLWGYHNPEVYGRAFIFTRRTAQKEQFKFSELCVTWWPYRRPPEGGGSP